MKLISLSINQQMEVFLSLFLFQKVLKEIVRLICQQTSPFLEPRILLS